MDRFDTLQLFVKIVEQGSFTKGAAMLDVPRATATYAIKELEARLSTRLLERTTRHVRPTLDGQAFYDRCVRILGELDDAESAFSHQTSNPRGVLRIDLHGTHATRIVLPRIDEFRARYPNIDLVVSSGDRLVDLVREGVDAVIRAGHPRDSSLIARPVAVIPQIVCASPAYLARAGIPRHPDDLARHDAVGFFSSTSQSSYAIELCIDRKVVEFKLRKWISVSDAENYVVCALRGCGLIQLPRFHVEDELADGRLIEVMNEWESPGMPMNILYPQHRQLAPRVRVFIEWASQLYAEKFGASATATARPKRR
ncbi:LysR family transcriptional regulator [Paraburkholderia phosphatilytica]|uniref:LysR family transcriptional regulator n=1 Tax=Paraburkholderia phosphatilytica TaxID=2282883 RepID=UPI000E49CFD6|nr:LysR family transcriptional regulator [Paraburkholderia phosphatilytica]